MWLALVCAAARGEREKPECQMTCWGGDRAEVRAMQGIQDNKEKKKINNPGSAPELRRRIKGPLALVRG